MKNKKIRFILGLVLVVFLSYSFAFMFTNYKSIKNRKNSDIKINDKYIKTDGFVKKGNKYVSTTEMTSIVIELKDLRYFHKFGFNYNSDNNFNWKLSYNGESEYGFAEEIVIGGNANKNINKFCEILDSKASIIKLEFESIAPIEIYNLNVDNRLEFFEFNYIFYIMLSAAVYLLVYFRKYISKHVEYLFLILALSFGFVLIGIHQIDIGKSWDDQIHFLNSYGLLNSKHTDATYNLTEVGAGFLDNTFTHFNTDEERDAFINYLNKADKKDLDINTYVGKDYTKVTYIPQTIWFTLGNLVQMPFNIQFTGAMIMNLLIYVGLTFWAIRKTPIGKYLMVVIGLIPTSLFLASSFSYDPPIIGLVLLGFAYYFDEMKNRDKKLSVFSTIVMMTSFVVASCPKAIYAPLLLILLTFKSDKFKNKKQEKTFKALIVLLTLLIMSTFVLPMLSGTMGSDLRGGDTSVGRQLSLILHQPLSFAHVFYETAGLKFFHKLISLNALFSFGYYDVIENANSYYLYLIALIMAIFIKNNNPLKTKEKLFLAGLLIILYCVVWGTMYLAYTPVGANGINGVQNRYFFPLLFGAFSLLSTDKIKINFKDETIYMIYVVLMTITTFSPLYDIFM